MSSTRNGPIRAGLVALVMVLAACGSSSDDLDSVAETTTSPPTTEAATTTEATTTTAAVEDDAEAEEADDEPAEPAVYDPDATPLTVEFQPLEEDTYRVDTVGTPFSFTVDQALFVQPNAEAFFVVTEPSSQGPDDRDIVFFRMSYLSDPTQPNASLEDQGDGWPVDDFAGWLDNLSDDVVVSDRVVTTLGGLDALRADLQLAPGTECSDDDGFCVGFAHNRLVNGKSLDPGSLYRVWVVDQEGESPLAVVVGVSRESDAEWFDTADDVLATLAFGDIGPNPIPSEGDLWTLGFSSEVPAGTVELPALGGISIELTEESFVFQDARGFTAIPLDGQPADTELLELATDMAGNALTTTDDVVAVLTENTDSLAGSDPTTIGDLEARVFDVEAAGPRETLKVDADEEGGWRPPPQGRLWLIEHPERGVLMVTAEAFENVEESFPLVLARTEAILASLEFIELG